MLDVLATAHDRALPTEACGVLLGVVQRGRVIATEAVVARSSASGRGAFEIPDYELRRLGAYAEDRGLRVVALFHSHPSGDSRLSAGDRAALRYSTWPWIIVTRRGKAAPISLTAYARGGGTRIPVHIKGLG